MSRKTFVIFVLTVALIVIAFVLGTLYERWQEAKSTLDLDRSLILLLARPSDFEFTGGVLQNRSYTQSYYDPASTSVYDYQWALSSFAVSFPATDTLLGFQHTVRKYVPGEMPETTWWDQAYRDVKANTEMEVHLLNIKELDENSRAFCAFGKKMASIVCYIESQYDEIISNFEIWSSNMEETQIVDFIITPAIAKFYDRLSKHPIN